MQDQTQLLMDLQELDQELQKIRQGRRLLEIEESDLDAELERVQGMVDSLSSDVDGLQEEHRQLEQALAMEQDNVEKAEGRLPSIKTQKEYVAVLKEIDTAKKVNKDIQDRIQEKTAEIDVLAKDLEEKEAELAGLTEKAQSRKSEIHQALADFDGSLGAKGGNREKLLKQLPKQIAKRYQLLLDRREGIAVVEARNGACLGCNMHLPPQLFNSLLQSQEVQSCPHCNRLLFVQALD